MIFNILEVNVGQPVSITQLFPAITFVTALVCYLRRKEEIGGWFLYMYYWIFAVLYSYAKDFFGHLDILLRSSQRDEAQRAAFLLAALPRILGLTAVAIILIILVKQREWFLVQRLKLVLGATVLIAAISVGLDVEYFPNAVLVNVLRLVMLCVCFLYLCFSERIRRVFQTKDCGEAAAKQILC
jgi:hypothetical protein